MKIAVLDDYQRVAHLMADWDALDCSIDYFHQHLDSEENVVQALQDYDAIVAMRERTKFPAAVLKHLPKLRLLVTTGMRNRSIDVPAAMALGITVCGTPWAEDATVELTWGLVLGLARFIPHEDASLRANNWQSSLGVSLRGKTLAVLGLGNIGTRVATIGKAFGMRVIAYSPNLTVERAQAAGVSAVSKDEFFAQADVLSIHLILSDTTRGIVGAAELSTMKSTALLVNTSRGPLVDEAALAASLCAGALGGAAVDVYTEEPIPIDHPLLKAPRTILTPHIGYVTQDVYQIWYGAAVEDIRAFLEGQMLRRLEV